MRALVISIKLASKRCDMSERRPLQPHVVAIGGVGGSGTRLGAALLQLLGYYIGGDLNETLDNLWFTLLFERRSILMECEPNFRDLSDLFFLRMAGATKFSPGQREYISRLAQEERLRHSREWLCRRAESFLNGTNLRQAGQPWGWKEPNTHIVIGPLLKLHRDLRYIHFTRHPLDMAFSPNQNQLENWGPILLSRNVGKDPRQSLSYWCAAHRRIHAVMQQWPQRTMIVDFDALCADPQKQSALVAGFLNVAMPDDLQDRFGCLIDHSRWSRSRRKSVDLTQFVPDDMNYVRELGYAI